MRDEDHINRGALKAHYSWLPKDATLTPKDFDDIIDAQPAVDVEPVVYAERKEKVYNFDGEDHLGTVCSKCDASQFDGLGNAQRCYNCGAHFGTHGKER